MTDPAPQTFRVNFETTQGTFVIQVNRDWSPHGADRFHFLVKNGFYDDVRFFRVVKGFMVQFGMSGDPKLNGVWKRQPIPDDPVKQGNARGFVSFAMAGPNSRTTQVFINYVDNSKVLDGQGFAAFGQVVEGMDVVDKLNGEYGDGPPRGRGPEQYKIINEGNAYLMREFPQMDYVKKATIGQ